MVAPIAVLDGYYGVGNLGDDLLMLLSYSVLREVFAADEICIRIMGGSYVGRLIGEPCHLAEVRHFAGGSLPPSCKLLVVGGGGFLADHFGCNSLRVQLEQVLLHTLGVQALRNLLALGGLKPILKKLLNRYGATTDTQGIARIAFGIGIGPFPNRSRKEITSALFLSGYDLVIVRDPDSLDWCRRWKLRNVLISTDLAFLHERWLPLDRRKPNVLANRIGVIVRDWPVREVHSRYLNQQAWAVKGLRARGFDIRFISLNPTYDPEVLDYLGAEDVLCWNPEIQDLDDFIKRLRVFDVIITSRAHGAIMAACMGIPSICVGIAHKLEKIHEMLTPGTLIWNQPFEADGLIGLTLNLFEDYESYRIELVNTVNRRNREAQEAASVVINLGMRLKTAAQ